MRKLFLIGILIMSNQLVFALEDYEDKSYLSWTLGLNTNNLTDGTFLHSNIRFLAGTKYFNSRLKIGLELTYNEVEGATPGYMQTGDMYYYRTGESASIMSIQILHDLLLYPMDASRVCFHCELGFGIGNNDIYMGAVEKQEIEYVASLKFVMSYGMMDLFAATYKTLEKEKVSMFVIGVGFKLKTFD